MTKSTDFAMQFIHKLYILIRAKQEWRNELIDIDTDVIDVAVIFYRQRAIIKEEIKMTGVYNDANDTLKAIFAMTVHTLFTGRAGYDDVNIGQCRDKLLLLLDWKSVYHILRYNRKILTSKKYTSLKTVDFLMSKGCWRILSILKPFIKI